MLCNLVYAYVVEGLDSKQRASFDSEIHAPVLAKDVLAQHRLMTDLGGVA